MQSNAKSDAKHAGNSIILSLAYYNNILSLQNVFQDQWTFIIIWVKLTHFI